MRVFLIFLCTVLCCSCSSPIKFTKLMDQYQGEPEILLQAENTLAEIEQNNPQSPFVDSGKGLLALCAGHISYSRYTKAATQKAASFFVKALQTDPNLFDAYLNGAYAFLYMPDFRAAESFAKKVKAIDSASPLLTILYAEIALRDKDYEESIKLAQRIINNETDQNLIIKAHLILLRVYTSLNQPELAYESYEKLIALRPKSPWILMACSEFLMKQYEYDKAVEYAEKSLAIRGKVIPEIHDYISDLYVKQAIDESNRNKQVKSLAALNNAIRHNPKNLQAYYSLGEKYYRFWEQTKDRRYLNEAIRYAYKMLEINPTDSDGKNLLEKIYKQLN